MLTHKPMPLRPRILLICWLLALTAMAQTVRTGRQVNASNGLTNNFVLSMALDGDGNLWVGTESGLNRIAGRTVTAYHRDQMGSANDKILSLFHDRHGHRMLIGTERGLQAYDLRNHRFGIATVGDKVVDYGLADMADDHGKGVWLVFANGKIQHLDCTDNSVSTLNVPLPGNRCGLDDGQGRLYVGHGKDGMTIVDYRKGVKVLNLIHHDGDEKSLPGNNVRRIVKDTRGRIWVGTDCGIALFDPATNTFRQERRYAGSVMNDNVFDIKELTNGQIWVATDVGGVFNMEEPEGRLLASMNSRSILQDNYQNIWVGNHSTGVDFLPARKPFLGLLDYLDASGHPKHVYGVCGDSEGRLWMSSEDELTLWSTPQTGDTPQLLSKWNISGMRHRAHSFARCLMADRQGCVWMGMEDEGVIRFDPRSGRFTPVDLGFGVSDIHSFYEDDDGAVWIGAEKGVCRYFHGSVTPMKVLDRLTGGAPVTSFIRLSTGELLMATQGGGVVVVNTSTMAARNLTMAQGLPSNNINQALADRQKGIWLATSEGLVHLPDVRHLGKISIYDRKAGLTDHQIRAIQQDAKGRIWASTFTSLACLDPATGLFYNYTQQVGNGVGGFMEGSAAADASGNIVFGSAGGACVFRPEETTSSQQVSPVRITLCEVYGQTGSDSLDHHSLYGEKIVTSYRMNTLRLSYTIADYAQVDAVEYSYRMVGLNDKWYYNGTDHDVMFRNLGPGNYTFVIRAKLKSQNWEEATTAQLSIRVTPPLWQTWWARTLYLLLVLAAAYYLFKQYKRRLALRNSLEMARRENLQKQELNEERLRFFTNITHELRTPLTLILGPLEDLVADTRMPASVRQKVNLINKNAQRLRDLINQILEFRKTETQNRRLSVARGDVAQLVRETVVNYKELNRNPQLQITCHAADGLPQVYFDSEVITTVLNNLLSNALKYTEQGSIDVQVGTDGQNRLFICVTDTGYGIASDALPHIFDRYYQAKGSHQASGTGIGLALTKSLADLHEAQLKVESREGMGSCFTLWLDVDNTYPQALHKEDSREAAVQNVSTLTAPDSEEAEAEEPMAAPQLLVVEDNDDIRQYIAESLGDDYRILQAVNGEEGLAMARQHIPDLIVSDIMMPKMNGISLTRQIKDDIRTSHIPVVLLTAKDALEDKEEGYDSGADSYLTKPFTAKLLASRIKNLLTSRRRLAELLSQGSWSPLAEAPTGAAYTVGDARISRLDQEFMQRLDRTIEENIEQTDVDMPFLTDKMAISHSTFYRKVKALTGMTAKEYVRKRKLQHCYRLLQSGDYNVTEAALMTGFNQMTHFREVFKNEFGILPSEVNKKR